jgi:zinc D-Ala-D-Ala carboxypeptidase
MNSSNFFTEDELSCNCGKCDGLMDDNFLLQLDSLRTVYGRPMILSSAYRCENYNYVVGSSKNSAHVSGLAVDVIVAGVNAYDLVACAMDMGFSGVGIKQNGEWSSRFIHLDMDEGEHRPRIWSY